MGSDQWNESPRPGFPAPERDGAAYLEEQVREWEAIRNGIKTAVRDLEIVVARNRPTPSQTEYEKLWDRLKEAEAELVEAREHGEKYFGGYQVAIRMAGEANHKAEKMQAIVEAARAFISDEAKWKALRDALDALDRATGKEGDHG